MDTKDTLERLGKRWVLREGPNGGLVVAPSPESRKGTAFAIAAVAAGWYGWVAYRAVLALQQLERHGATPEATWDRLLGLLPFAFVGLLPLWAIHHALHSELGWRIGPGRLERAGETHRNDGIECYVADLLLEPHTDSDGQQRWRLVAHAGNELHELETGRPADLLTLANAIGSETGWPVRLHPDFQAVLDDLARQPAEITPCAAPGGRGDEVAAGRGSAETA